MHPNATASLLTSATTALILYVANRAGYAHLTEEDAVALTGSLSAGVLWVGRRGLRAALVDARNWVWRPAPKPAPAPEAPAPAPEPPAAA